FAARLGPLDDYVGKLPDEGGVLIICASYNGAPPDNAARFVEWLGSDLAKDAFAKVRYAVFGCGNTDWAAPYQPVPRLIDSDRAARALGDERAALGAGAVAPGGEGVARSAPKGKFKRWFPAAPRAEPKKLGIE